MRKIYVAHPLRGRHPHTAEKIAENHDRITRICRQIARDHTETLILSPIHAFQFFDALGDQAAPLDQCRKLLSMSDELWVYGDWRTSEGCRMEVTLATERGIPVKFMEYSA
jgi:hypothetical protein